MEFVALLAEGVERWNEWRSQHPLIPCTLAGQDLSNGYFFECNFTGVDLSGADFQRACLIGADLRWANLSRTNFSGAYLGEATLEGAKINGANFAYADIERTTFPRWHPMATKSSVVNAPPTKTRKIYAASPQVARIRVQT